MALYRAENGRARGIDSHQIRAFQTPISLALDFGDANGDGLALRSPEDYERERMSLQKRFEQIRTFFNEEASS
jgi:hypothetical protein